MSVRILTGVRVTDFLQFYCSACGQANLIDRADLPEDGVDRSCQGCGASTLVRFQDTAAVGSAPDEDSETPLRPPPAPPERGIGYHVRLETGEVAQLRAEVCAQAVQDARVRPWDLVSDDGQQFLPASEHPELASLFVDSDFVAIAGYHCVNHRDGEPAGTCYTCGRSYCLKCMSSLIQVEPKRCPACSGSVQPPDPRLRERPAWERWREVLRYPVKGGAWRITAISGLLLWFASLSVYFVPLYLMALILFVHACVDSMGGGKTLALTGSTNFKKLYERAVEAAVFTIVLLGVITVIQLYATPSARVLLWPPITVIFFAYYPMAVGLLLLDSDKRRALQPRSVVKAVRELKEHYLLAVLLLIAISVLALAGQTIATFIPYLGPLVAALSLAYAILAEAHTLGSLLYLHRERILGAYR